MEISNSLPKVNVNMANIKKPSTSGIDMDVLSVFMKDGVTLSGGTPDTGVPDMEWNFKFKETGYENVLKSSGMKGGSSTTEISFIHTNDEHDPHFEKLAKETTVIKEREKVHGDENSFIVNTGDITYESFNDKPGPQFMGPVADVFKAQGMEFMVPGNHEFQHGGKWLQDNFLNKLEPEVLLGNVTFKSGGRPLEHVTPYTIQDVNGVKVGILGLTTPKHKTKAHPNVGFDVNVESVQQAAARLVPEMKKAGADIIAIIAHEGVNRCVDTASSVAGIDLIIAGHDHQELQSPKEIKNPDGRTTLVVEAASHGKYVGDVTLEVDTKSKEVVGANYKLFSTSSVQPDPEVQAIVNKWK